MNIRLVALALLAVVLAACSAAPEATIAPTTAPTAAPFAITTAPVANAVCMDALMSGKLSRDGRTGLGVMAADGQQMAVEWPFRYSARNEGGRLVLIDDTGKVLAREGDTIQVGGGFGNVMWHACGPVSVTQAS